MEGIMKQNELNGNTGDIRSDSPQELSIEAKAQAEEEKQAVANTAKNRLQLTCDMDDVLAYATVHNGAHIVRDVCVKNLSESDLDNLMLRISSRNNLIENLELGIEKIKPGEERHFKYLNVIINVEYLRRLGREFVWQMLYWISTWGPVWI